MSVKNDFATNVTCRILIQRQIGLKQQGRCLLHGNGNACNCGRKVLTMLKSPPNLQSVPARWPVYCIGRPGNYAFNCGRKKDGDEPVWRMGFKALEAQPSGCSRKG